MRYKQFVKIILLLLLGMQLFTTCFAANPNFVLLPFFSNQKKGPVLRPFQGVFKAESDYSNNSNRINTLIKTLFEGPTESEKAAGYLTPIPEKTKLVSVKMKNKDVEIYISKEFLEKASSPDAVIEYMEIAVSNTLIHNLTEEQKPTSVRYWIEDTDGTFKPDTKYTIPGKETLPKHQPQYQPFAAVPSSNTVSPFAPVEGKFPTTRPTGLLSGKRIGINAGHGWWYDANDGWGLQREIMVTGFNEDFNNWQRCLFYTARYLYNAGADVFPSREWDCNTTELIFNNDQGAPVYTETSTISNGWATSSSNGYNSTYRYTSTSGTATTATATWQVIVPLADYYAVYEFNRPSANRVNDAQFIINHSGGQSIVNVNQKILGVPSGFSIDSVDGRWVYIGNYYFDVGTTTITLTNFSQDSSGSVVIADAIRLGGGFATNVTPITQSGGEITKPWWQMAAEYWTKYQGAPASVYDWGSSSTDGASNDWYSRPRHTIWQDCDAHLMIHTNSQGDSTTLSGTASGTNTYIRPDNTSAFMYVFATVVNYQIKSDVRAYWDPTWSATTQSYINYAELAYLESAGIPGALFEVAYYDSPIDGEYLVNQKFDDILGRAFYKGVVRYFYSNPTIAPLPPLNLTVANVGDGTIRLSWIPQTDIIEPTAVPNSYRIYLSTNGKGFDNGVYSSTTSYIYSGLTPNKVYYFQVSALNSGGESMPTETLAVRVKASGTAPILMVYADDRIDTRVGIDRSDPYNPKVNQTFDYIIQHAQAVDAYGAGFDSADHKALAGGAISLAGYQAVIWISGQQSTADTTFSPTEQTLVSSYLDGGGNLFVTGSEIGYDLVYAGSAADSTFYANYLKASFVGDDAGTYNVNTGIGIFSSVSSFSFSNGSGGSYTGSRVTYNVPYPDQIAPFGGSATNLTYSGGAGGNAGIQYNGSFKVIYFGFPFETILSSATRNTVMSNALTFFGVNTRVADWELYN